MADKKPREPRASKSGIIMAVAGSAAGLGNFLRFPVQAVFCFYRVLAGKTDESER